jgi:hypothetical protein
VLQPDSLKFGSCKFNFIINIINITLRSGVAAKSKILEYNFAKKLKIFKFFYKKNELRHRTGIKASWLLFGVEKYWTVWVREREWDWEEIKLGL